MTRRAGAPVVYVESSAVVAWLFGEPSADRIDESMEASLALVTSALTLTEVERAVVRAEALGIVAPADAAELRAALADLTATWTVVDVTDGILRESRLPFPREPVRTLDAIHLATVRMCARSVPTIAVLALDERVRTNAAQLGVVVLP